MKRTAVLFVITLLVFNMMTACTVSSSPDMCDGYLWVCEEYNVYFWEVDPSKEKIGHIGQMRLENVYYDVCFLFDFGTGVEMYLYDDLLNIHENNLLFGTPDVDAMLMIGGECDYRYDGFTLTVEEGSLHDEIDTMEFKRYYIPVERTLIREALEEWFKDNPIETELPEE